MGDFSGLVDYKTPIRRRNVTKYPSLPQEWMTTNKPKVVIKQNEHDDGSVDGDEAYDFDKVFSLRKFLLVEILGIGDAGPSEPTAVESMDNFLNVPAKFEQLMTFGVCVCVDVFLYMITYLPIRVVYAALLLCYDAIRWRINKPGLAKFHRMHGYDLMRGLLIFIATYILNLFHMSRIYHYIRMQTTIKLYVLTAMMEILDKLLCSFGQDAFESLFWKTRNSPTFRKVSVAFLITSVYVVIHSLVFFTSIVTLTVAINTSDQTLMSVLILNNFAEIKGFVFKKFDRQNLFQLACSDITERFQMTLFYCLIVCVGLCQADDVWAAMPKYILVVLAMLACEVIVDWVKHAFITKFNHIDAECYIDYSCTLRKDILDCYKDKVIMDHTYAISKRLGLSQMPLACVFLRYISLAFNSPRVEAYLATMSATQIFVYGAGGFLFLLVFKIVFRVLLVYHTGVTSELEIKKRSPKKSQQVRNANRNLLSDIERYTMVRGRIEG